MKHIKNNKIITPRSKSASPIVADTRFEEAVRFFNTGDFAGAVAKSRELLATGPDDPGPHSLLGQIAMTHGRPAEALEHFDYVLKVFPTHGEMRSHRALALLKLGRKDEAKEELEAVLAMDPRCYTALKVNGAMYSEGGDSVKAEELLRAAHAVNPNDAEGLYLLGRLLFETDRTDEAVPYLKRAIKIRPRGATGFNLMGAVYRSRCRFRTALSFYRHALRLEPNDVASNVNYGVGLMDVGRMLEAITHFQRYLEIDPDCDQARFNMSTALLQIGRLKEGWEAYEARRKMHKLRDHTLPYADWQGESLKGKTILVLAEQGIGDEIWAASMFDDIINVAEHCLIECDSRLVTLYSRSFPQATILPRLPDAVYVPKERPVDFMSLGMSLARWLRVEPEQFPGKPGYLLPDPERQEHWRWRVAQLGAGLKVGISWRSLSIKGTRSDSYTTLSDWVEIFKLPGVSFVNLQYGECSQELLAAETQSGVKIHNFKDIDLRDQMDDVTALMSVLDVVIAPDNTVSAMAGALNIPVLQFVVSKYWNNVGKDYHPWYPSAHLFFRPWDQDWAATMRAVATELRRRSQQKATEGSTVGIDAELEQHILRERVGRAAWFISGKQTAKARAICEEVLALRPEYSDALLMLGVLERMAGRHVESEAWLRKVIGQDSLHAEAYNYLGAVLLESGRADEARAELERALELRPNYPDALNNLGNVYATKLHYREASAYYQRAISAFGGFMTARFNYALTLEHLGEIDAAITEYQTVVEGDPRHAEAWNNLGNLHGLLQRNEEAVKAYRMALSANPDLMIARTNLAKKILAAGGDIDEALEHLKAAFAAHPEDERIANNLGAAYAAKGDMEAATEQFKKAVALKPDYADAYRNLGLALQQLGRLEEARDALLEGIQLMTGAIENPQGDDAKVPKLLH
ncbi:MAG: tetratricopeptide repeat protein [Betaproteobacteria bacterium]|nr:tetratricopeptide repeat protein [Betaproteobacteria bacterium]